MEVLNDYNEPARLVGRKSKSVETDDEKEPTKESIREPSESVACVAPSLRSGRSRGTAASCPAAAHAGLLLKVKMEVINNNNQPVRLVDWKSKCVETDDEEESTKESVQCVCRSKKPNTKQPRLRVKKREQEYVHLISMDARLLALHYGIQAPRRSRAP
ncbi:hypothetical protein BU17DRAFT_83185 [Hysterangium stoloniferum]|nr:hypothetical protein BU17DRAFT_83185 [Hysterangium stoloniferum]